MAAAQPSTNPSYQRNDLTELLLSYEREGANAISVPANWSKIPPIFERTQLVEEMERLADSIYATDKSTWYFLVGAPGNGKSEAIGALLRRATVHAASAGTTNPLSGGLIGGGGLVCRRYSIELPRKRSLLILQDATVPEDRQSDAAVDLSETLNRALEQDGTSVIVCANRGILQRASALGGGQIREILDEVTKYTREDAPAAPVPRLVNRPGSNENVELATWPLDHESILFGTNDATGWRDPVGSVLDLVIRRVTEASRWDGGPCGGCTATSHCPFRLNSEWLRDSERRSAYLRVLRRAEVWSGQRLVMREALELLANSIVGSRHDFGGVHPCDWVGANHRILMAVGQRDDKLESLLELLSRRIYMSMFSRQAPGGLEIDGESVDSDFLRALAASPPLNDLATAIEKTNRSSSKQVGLTRFVGPDGTFRSLDPVLGPAVDSNLSIDLDVRSSSQRDEAQAALGGTLPGIEVLLYDYASALEADADKLTARRVSRLSPGAVVRWLSAYTSRIVGLARAEHPRAVELEKYLELLVDPTTPFEYKGRTLHLGDVVRNFLSAGGGAQYPIGGGLSVSIGNVFAEASPEFPRHRSISPAWPASDRLAVEITPMGSNSAYTAPVPASVFLFLLLAEARGLEDWCMPRESRLALSRWIRAVGGKAGVTRSPGIQASVNTPGTDLEILVSGGRVTVKRA